MPRKIIIDTDPGVDDAMAIFYALHAPEVELIGLTTVFGNVHTETATTNALRLLEIDGRMEIPVAAGADRPLVGTYHGPAEFVHGKDGQGDANLPAPKTKPVEKKAWEFIIEQVMAAPGDVTLVPIAPLTNIALALTLEPKLASNLKQIVLMGGNAYGAGNASPAGEANIWHDPEAADIVFGADCPITMVGLDVTEKVFMTADVLDGIAKIGNPRAQHLSRILPVYRKFHVDWYGQDGINVHDSTTITYLRDPSLFATVQHAVRVDTSSGIGRGKTWPALGVPDREPEWQGRRPVNICIDVNVDQAIQMELERLNS